MSILRQTVIIEYSKVKFWVDKKLCWMIGC